MTPLSILGIGLLLGIRHATDADHVVAVSTIVTQQKKLHSAGIIGALWGIGHTITVFIVGTGIIIFHLVIPARVGLSMEFAVAVVLILLGVLNLTGVMQRVISILTPHTHEHIHLHLLAGDPHIHIHGHEEPVKSEVGKFSLNRMIGDFGWFQVMRPVAVGLVHGLAGSAAIALLILSSIRDPKIAIMYLFIFGIGTMAGMMVITTLIGVPIIITSKKFTDINRYVTIASGIVSLVFGCLLAYEIGINRQLFGANPIWSPR